MYALDSSSLSSIPKLIITSIDASSNTSLQSTMKSNEDISNTTYCLYLLALSAVIFILIYPSFILWASRRSAASFIITFTILFAVSFIVSRHLILTSSIAAFAVSFTEAFAGYNIGIVEFYIGGAVGRHHSAESPSITPATNEYYLYIGGAVGTSKEFAFKIIETPNDTQQLSTDRIFLDPTNGPTTDFTPAPPDMTIKITHDTSIILFTMRFVCYFHMVLKILSFVIDAHLIDRKYIYYTQTTSAHYTTTSAPTSKPKPKPIGCAFKIKNNKGGAVEVHVINDIETQLGELELIEYCGCSKMASKYMLPLLDTLSTMLSLKEILLTFDSNENEFATSLIQSLASDNVDLNEFQTKRLHFITSMAPIVHGIRFLGDLFSDRKNGFNGSFIAAGGGY